MTKRYTLDKKVSKNIDGIIMYALLDRKSKTKAFATVKAVAKIKAKCDITDGLFIDGLFAGGTFNGGTFTGGDFWEGVFNGGEYYGGEYHGGVYELGKFVSGDFNRGQYDEYREYDGGNYYGYPEPKKIITPKTGERYSLDKTYPHYVGCHRLYRIVKNGGAVTHSTALEAYATLDAITNISNNCEIVKGAFIDGIFNGGVFNGGVFNSGVFNGGVFNGGEYFGGEYLDGIYNGGTFLDGSFIKGTFNQGTFTGERYTEDRVYGEPLGGGGGVNAGVVDGHSAFAELVDKATDGAFGDDVAESFKKVVDLEEPPKTITVTISAPLGTTVKLFDSDGVELISTKSSANIDIK